ncbi:MAG TPA: Maf family protein [Candidatus Paceibacterota bacterium]|nr:Maf family protein [Candidatus Paceibacterota bacterium]
MNKKKKIKLILGSASPFRKKLLEEAGFVFDVKTADIDEKQIRHEDFKKLVLRLALAKLKAILAKNKFNKNTIVITSDWVASYNGELREKPTSKEEVIAWLKEYPKGKTIAYCSIVVHHVGLKKTLKAVDTSSIIWRKIPDRVIYLLADEPSTYKAAAFNDRSFFHYVKSLEGSIDTVIGVPVRILEDFLQELGYFE